MQLHQQQGCFACRQHYNSCHARKAILGFVVAASRWLIALALAPMSGLLCAMPVAATAVSTDMCSPDCLSHRIPLPSAVLTSAELPRSSLFYGQSPARHHPAHLALSMMNCFHDWEHTAATSTMHPTSSTTPLTRAAAGSVTSSGIRWPGGCGMRNSRNSWIGSRRKKEKGDSSCQRWSKSMCRSFCDFVWWSPFGSVYEGRWGKFVW